MNGEQVSISRRQTFCSKSKYCLQLLAVCLFISSFAGSASVAGVSNASVVSQADWVSALKSELPQHECKAESDAVRCFKSMTTLECVSQLKSDIEMCAARARLPARIDRTKAGVQLAFRVGSCAGAKFEKANESRFVVSDACASRRKVN